MTKDHKKIINDFGMADDTLFIETLQMYEEQRTISRKLRAEINKLGPIVQKEYVKGRPNPTANPAIDAYNKTMTAINQTLLTLKKMLKESTGGVKAGEEEDQLERALGIIE